MAPGQVVEEVEALFGLTVRSLKDGDLYMPVVVELEGIAVVVVCMVAVVNITEVAAEGVDGYGLSAVTTHTRYFSISATFQEVLGHIIMEGVAVYVYLTASCVVVMVTGQLVSATVTQDTWVQTVSSCVTQLLPVAVMVFAQSWEPVSVTLDLLDIIVNISAIETTAAVGMEIVLVVVPVAVMHVTMVIAVQQSAVDMVAVKTVSLFSDIFNIFNI